MSNTYERLKNIADSPAFAEFADKSLSRLDGPTALELANAKFGLSGQSTYNANVYWLSTSRHKQPACITVSRQMYQKSSPSAMYVSFRGIAMIQVFEAGGYDYDVAGPSALPQAWTEAQDRVLLV